MLKWIRRIFCDHEFYQDYQIRKFRCEKCGEEHWMKGYKNLFPNVWNKND